MGRRTDIPWGAIQSDAALGMSVTDLAEKHGTTRQSIWRRMKADDAAGRPWKTPESLAERVTGLLANDKIANRIADRVTDEMLSGARAQHDFLVALGKRIKLAEADVKKIKDPAKRVQASRHIVEMGLRWLNTSRNVVTGAPSDSAVEASTETSATSTAEEQVAAGKQYITVIDDGQQAVQTPAPELRVV